MNPTVRTALAIVCILVITLCSILITQRAVGHIGVDLTQEHLYTLSPGTRGILRGIGKPLTVKLYYSRVAATKGPEQIRFWNNYYLYVRALLEEYARLGKGKIDLQIIDPRPFSDAEDDAIRSGVQKFALSQDENFFFGLVVSNEFEKEKVIPFFEPDRQRFVEYDVSKVISELTQPEKKTVGVISSLPVIGSDMSPQIMQFMRMQGQQPQAPWMIVEDLRSKYEVRKAQIIDGAVEDGIDYLMVVHPKDLDEPTLFAIDQFVMKGGKLIVFVDPNCMVDMAPQDPSNPYAGMMHDSASNLNALLSGWGVEMRWTVKKDEQTGTETKTPQVAVDRTLAQTASRTRYEPPQSFLPFLLLNEECMSEDVVISADLHAIHLRFAGALRKTGADGVRFDPLLSTTKVGTVWQPASVMELRGAGPANIRDAVIDGDTPVVLACLLTGEFKTNFPEGLDAAEPAPATRPAETPPPGANVITAAKDGAAVVVVADVDCISDRVAYRRSFFGPQKIADNASLVYNILGFLSGDDALISIRSRGKFSRPFKVVEEIEEQAEEKTRDEIKAFTTQAEQADKDLRALEQTATQENIHIVRREFLAKRQQLQQTVEDANRKIRRLRNRRREDVEALESTIKLVNNVVPPVVILLIATGLAAFRYFRAKHYAARRTD